MKMDGFPKLKVSLGLSEQTTFRPFSKAEKIMLECLADIDRMSSGHAKLYGRDQYGNRVKRAFSELNKLN
jgi:hypothetical protein